MKTADEYRTTQTLLWVVVSMVALASCSRHSSEHQFSFTRFAMDTVVEYTVLAASHDQARTAVDAAHEEVERVERLLWEESETSEIRALNRATSSVAVSQEVSDFLKRAKDVSGRTDGSFDVTIKPVLDAYGFFTGAPAVPAEDELARRIADVGADKIDVTSGPTVTKEGSSVAVAVGGIAKGYAVDRAAAVLERHGIRNGVVNAGGDAYCLGTNRGKPWRVGIRHPDQSADMIAILEISNAAVATSGDYERFFEVEGRRYHHILDPRTGRPARAARSATVVAPTAELADALATAVFVLGAQQGIETVEDLPGVEAFVVDMELRTRSSRGLPLVRR